MSVDRTEYNSKPTRNKITFSNYPCEAEAFTVIHSGPLIIGNILNNNQTVVRATNRVANQSGIDAESIVKRDRENSEIGIVSIIVSMYVDALTKDTI